MWGWSVLAACLGLLLLPVGICASYNEFGLMVSLKLGPVPVRLYPRPKRVKKKEDIKTDPSQKAQRSHGSNGGKLTDFLPIVRSLLDFLRDLRLRIKVKNLHLKIILAGGDPCDLSVNYGRTWAAVGSLQPLLDKLFTIKRQNIDVSCDYISDEPAILGRIDISIMLIRLLVLTARYAIRILKQYISIKNQRKGGAIHEPKSSSNA